MQRSSIDNVDILAAVPPGTLCSAFVSELGVSATSISIFGWGGRQSTVCVSDALAARADELQFELGEGPRWEALGSRAPVLCSDLASAGSVPWPLFRHAAGSLGIRAIFAFPMLMGAAMVGIVDLYSTTVRTVDGDFVARATVMAGQVSSAAVQHALRSAENHESPESRFAPALRREVHQATGMIVSQLNISATEAFSRLQGRAFATDRSIESIAHDVVERLITFAEFPE